jgi:hypothetical protein
MGFERGLFTNSFYFLYQKDLLRTLSHLHKKKTLYIFKWLMGDPNLKASEKNYSDALLA